MLSLEFSWYDVELVGRLFLSVILGAVVGFEREISEKPAGLRTHIFVCMGACLFTVASFYLLPKGLEGSFDVTRIAAGVVAGVSFIGAGSIIASGKHVKGLTTASSLWVVASIGLMVGIGSYLLPVVATIIVFVVLRVGKYGF